MQPYILFSLLAAFFFAFSSLTNKFVSRHKISDSWTLLFYYYLSILPFLFLIPLFFDVTIPTSGWVYLFLYALTFFIGNIFFTLAIYKLDASTFAPFLQIQAAFIALLAFLFLGERFPAQNYLLILMMLVGSMLVSVDERMSIKTYFKLGILLILFQQFFHALSNLFAGFALRDMNAFTFIFWGDLLAVACVFLIVPFVGFSRLKVSFSQVKPLFLMGFFATIGATALFTAFKTNLTISSALSLLTSPIVLMVTIIASIFKPNLLEHHTVKVYIIRAVGVALILVSAVKLSIGN